MGVGNTKAANNESLAYTYQGTWKEAPEIDLSVPAGAGAILSTPTDMTKFVQALFDLKLVSKSSLDQMKAMRDGEGMGLEPFSFAGRTLYGHTGGSNVSGAWLAYEPDEKVAMAYGERQTQRSSRSLKSSPLFLISTGTNRMMFPLLMQWT